MTIAEWEKRLADHFSFHGVVGGHLTDVLLQEQRYGQQYAQTYKGQVCLIDSFQSFYVETLDLAISTIQKQGWPEKAPCYAPVLVWFHGFFRRFRACETLLQHGYPLDGYSLMRDLKDRSLLMSGVVHNLITFPMLLGISNLTENDRDEWDRKSADGRKTAESLVRRHLLGEKSRLTKEARTHLKKWESLFHQEVHGSQLSFSLDLDALIKGKVPKIAPTFEINADSIAMFMNRATEVAWFGHRLLPFLQTAPMAFGEKWWERHSILDDSLRYMEVGFASLGKPVGEAFIALINTAFSFGENLCYRESDGHASA